MILLNLASCRPNKKKFSSQLEPSKGVCPAVANMYAAEEIFFFFPSWVVGAVGCWRPFVDCDGPLVLCRATR